MVLYCMTTRVMYLFMLTKLEFIILLWILGNFLFHFIYYNDGERGEQHTEDVYEKKVGAKIYKNRTSV